MKNKERNLYLSNVAVEKALNIFLERINKNLKNHEKEFISVIDSLGRVSASAVFAKYSSPNYNASAMDGIAVKASTTFFASERNPIQLKINKDFIYVDTGEPIKKPYDAVIMIEDVVEIDEERVEIIKAASPWQHIRPIGEDIVANEMIIPSNHIIRPVDIGALLSGGIYELKVYKKPKVGIIPTGTEIIEPGEKMEDGKIIESNSRVFEGLVKELGGEPNRYKPVPDDYYLLKSTILKAIDENHIVIINAGSSAGTKDYTKKLVDELGEVLVHGIATKPGKPTILGVINEKAVIGIPGYPVSAYFVFDTFVKPLIKKYQGQYMDDSNKVQAVLSKRIVSSLKHKEFVRIKLGRVDEQLIATPLSRGAGVSMSLVRADGVFVIPQNSEGVEAGEKIEVSLLKPLNKINKTIVSIGSHDLIMDLIGNLIHKQNAFYDLSSAHVGSLGGIMALRRREAHIAPIHLLDATTGEYNVSFVKKYLSNLDMALIKGVKRVQGIIIQKGNPKNIYDFEDLLKEEIVFVNRQRGAGTRILLDYELKKRKINPSKIIGYDREMTTHMAVAAAVASGSADAGVGVLSAAKAMDLEFIPIGEEEYDFLVPVKYLDKGMIQLFIKVIKSKEFKEILENMGGYGLEHTGEIIKVK
ncbi:molybdopterin biosynthesis protein [Crassaminicella thermophila]|uniref:molybdopterin biosynthesis protein n=1 Tax=Crassaminicella thermophila TaxID=2599308 RepID=UPI001E609584|nr:molybdopterin biosynthesis protein [Crassaminicella thermophila]